MATYTKEKLSASTDGRGVLVGTTASIGSGTTIHTGSSNSSIKEEVWIYAQNTSSTSTKLTLGFGGSTDPNDLIELTITGESGLTLVVPGLTLLGNASGAPVVRANAATANVIVIHGYVNKIA
jgi:hypothetical protein